MERAITGLAACFSLGAAAAGVGLRAASAAAVAGAWAGFWTGVMAGGTTKARHPAISQAAEDFGAWDAKGLLRTRCRSGSTAESGPKAWRG
jgi:hypothetical protein